MRTAGGTLGNSAEEEDKDRARRVAQPWQQAGERAPAAEAEDGADMWRGLRRLRARPHIGPRLSARSVRACVGMWMGREDG